MKELFSQLFARWFRKRGARSFDGRADAELGAQAMHGHDHGAMPKAPMIDCETVMRQLWDYLDGELTAERADQIRAHIEMCKRCYPQYEFERSFLDALAARQRTHSDPERLRTQLMAALVERGLGEV